MNCITRRLNKEASAPEDINHGFDHVLIRASNQHRVFAIVGSTVRRNTVVCNVNLAVVHVVAATAYLTVAKAIAII